MYRTDPLLSIFFHTVGSVIKAQFHAQFRRGVEQDVARKDRARRRGISRSTLADDGATAGVAHPMRRDAECLDDA
jgi:hypothetical protein